MSAMSTDAAAPAPHPAEVEQVTVDVVVIGGGPVGENIAQYATEGAELTAAIVEGELIGGECSYYACIPSKALLRPLALAEASAHMEGVAPGSLRAAGRCQGVEATWGSPASSRANASVGVR